MEIPSHKENLVTIPDAVLVFYDMYIIEDCHEKKTFLVANGITEDAEKLIESVEKRLTEVLLEKEQVADGSFNIEITPNLKKEEYKQAVDEMIRYIIEGDIYITNMTQQLEVKSNKKPLDVDVYKRQVVSASQISSSVAFSRPHFMFSRMDPLKSTARCGTTPIFSRRSCWL